jgi:hypothetical protein
MKGTFYMILLNLSSGKPHLETTKSNFVQSAGLSSARKRAPQAGSLASVIISEGLGKKSPAGLPPQAARPCSPLSVRISAGRPHEPWQDEAA